MCAKIITFFSVLILRVFPSRRFTVNRGWVQYIGAVAPWRKTQRSIIDKYIQIRRTAAAFSVSRQPSYISVFLQIVQSSFYRGAGTVELGSYGVDPWPALTLFVRPVTQIHIHCLCPDRQAVVRIYRREVAHEYSSLFGT